MRNFLYKFKILPAIITTSLLTGCNPTLLPGIRDIVKQQTEKETARARERIAESKVLQDLDKICTDPILIKDFSFRNLTLSNKSVFITYHYYSPKTIDDIREPFIKTLTGTGWKVINRESSWDKLATFEKDNYWITLYYLGSSSGEEDNYAVACGLY